MLTGEQFEQLMDDLLERDKQIDALRLRVGELEADKTELGGMLHQRGDEITRLAKRVAEMPE